MLPGEDSDNPLLSSDESEDFLPLRKGEKNGDAINNTLNNSTMEKNHVMQDMKTINQDE